MAADSRMSEGGLCFMVPSPLTAIVALAAMRCPGRNCDATRIWVWMCGAGRPIGATSRR